jgi:predicted small secreted protein
MFTTRSHTSILARLSFRRMLAAAILVAGTGALIACSTTEGFGKDVKDLGGGIENSAAKNK